MSNFSMAVDIGGTFTDVVLRGSDGRTFVDKTLTTPKSLDVGFFSAIDAVLKTAGIAPAAVTDVLVHATTVVTNAVIERKGPLTALLVTEGFRDILTIRDEHRYEMFDPQIEFPEPLISRDMTFGVEERVLATGEVLKPIDVAKSKRSWTTSSAKASCRSRSRCSIPISIRRTSAPSATFCRRARPTCMSRSRPTSRRRSANIRAPRRRR